MGAGLVPGAGTLIGLVVGAVLRVLSRSSADVRYGIACAGLIAMAFCPLITAARILLAGPPAAAKTTATGHAGDVTASKSNRLLNATSTVKNNRTDRVETADGKFSSGREIISAAMGDAKASKIATRWRERIEAAMPAIVAAWLIGVSVMAVRLASGLLDVLRLTRREVIPPRRS